MGERERGACTAVGGSFSFVRREAKGESRDAAACFAALCENAARGCVRGRLPL